MVIAEPPRQEKHVECRNVAEALDRLPPQQRAAIILIALEGLPYDEAAWVMGVPSGTLRSRLSRGRESLSAFQRASARYGGQRRAKGCIATRTERPTCALSLMGCLTNGR